MGQLHSNAVDVAVTKGDCVLFERVLSLAPTPGNMFLSDLVFHTVVEDNIICWVYA